MNYVVMDLEWNQAMSSKSSVFNHLPIHLCGEIIEIGAVKLDENMQPAEEFTMDVKPVYFRRMHYKVKKITGIDKERLAQGTLFPEALRIFREWCGDDVVFLTWGNDDRNIMEQNIIIHDLDWDWISDWVNLQMIYNVQTGGDKNQKSLASAMEHFGIEQTRVAHDALGDAYNTALVSTHLDMAEGLRLYPEAERILSARMPGKEHTVIEAGPEPLLRQTYDGFASRSDALNVEEISGLYCPVCGQMLSGIKWINQGDKRYVNVFTCETDGIFLARLKFHKYEGDNTVSVHKLVYEGNEETLEAYKAKAIQARRRGRSHRPPRKSQPAPVSKD